MTPVLAAAAALVAAVAAAVGPAVDRLAARRAARARLRSLRPPGSPRRPAGLRTRLRLPLPRPSAAAPAGDVAALAALPDAVDLLGIAARAGLPALAALGAVASRAPPPWGEAMAAVVDRAERGERLVDALDELPARCGEVAHPLRAVLRAAADDGADLPAALDRLAADTRDLRRRRAEEAARRLPVRLLFPLVACSLPAFALLSIVPILAGALRALDL